MKFQEDENRPSPDEVAMSKIQGETNSKPIENSELPAIVSRLSLQEAGPSLRISTARVADSIRMPLVKNTNHYR